MALQAYLILKGQKQGAINGSITQKGRENSIGIIAVSHSVVSPRDAASGLPTGKRMHKPITVTQELDKAVPLLYNALVNNENITEWTCKFWEPSSTGAEKQYFTISLVNANIASIDFRMANNKHPDLMKFKEYLEIAYTYQKITWTWTDGGITAMDDWEAPVT
jgi:type VI secretion system secreted protein Hcp